MTDEEEREFVLALQKELEARFGPGFYASLKVSAKEQYEFNISDSVIMINKADDDRKTS